MHRWVVANKFLKKGTQKIPNMKLDEQNFYYCGVSNEKVNVACPSKPPSIHFNSEFNFRSITNHELFNAWKFFKKKQSTGSDQLGLAAQMLNLTISYPPVTDYLTYLVNRSFSENTFPTKFKVSAITPVPKVPNPTNPSQFRPVASQATLAKLTERCAYDQLIKYIDDNNIFYKNQFGFRKGHSCENAMLALINFIQQQIDKGNICLLVALDLSKAFDVIVREFFLTKLGWYGINPEWFRSCLTGRCQYVKGDNGMMSVVMETKRGCPQGSVNGPLIFSIYINDLPLVIQHCLTFLFADDTQLCISGKPNQLEQMKKNLVEDLMSTLDWMTKNGMTLNVHKTQLIVLGNAYNVSQIGQISLEVNDSIIVSRDSLKSLGLTIDSKLK